MSTGERTTNRIDRIFEGIEPKVPGSACPICGKAIYGRALNHAKNQYEYKHRFPVPRDESFAKDLHNSRLLRTSYCYQPLKATT